MKESLIHQRIESIWRTQSAKIVASLTRMVRDISIAEDLAQDTLVIALERWPVYDIPDNPGAWLMTVAKRKPLTCFVGKNDWIKNMNKWLTK